MELINNLIFLAIVAAVVVAPAYALKAITDAISARRNKVVVKQMATKEEDKPSPTNNDAVTAAMLGVVYPEDDSNFSEYESPAYLRT